MGLVGLDLPGQGLAIGPGHRLADLVQPGPGGAVAGKAHLPLELPGGDAAFAGCHEVDREKPAAQPDLGLLEDGALEQRVLLAAGHALIDDLGPQRVDIAMVAGCAAEAIRPACLEQISTALLIGAELGHERWQIFRQVVLDHRCPPTIVLADSIADGCFRST
jgi:hypothetical protein